MISQSIVLTVTLSLVAGFALRGDVTRNKRDAPFRGPPAPLNHDGTVAFTAEFQQANDIHNAAYAQEYQRLQAAEDLAAAHPDRTSPPSKDYSPQNNGQYNHQSEQFAPQEDDGQYRPHLYDNNQSTQQVSSPVYVSHQPQVPQQHYNPTASYQPTTQYSQQQYSPATQNQQHHVPAPLNPDGTVAHTPEYIALAASLHGSYHQALTRHRRSLNLYHGPPAPLNHDGTVANTPEVEHAIAVLQAAYAQEYQKHQAAGYGHQSYESNQEDDGQYKPHLYDNGDHSSQQEDVHYSNNHYGTSHYSQEPSYSHNPEAHVPAPLNHDGTVAHTAEYKAVAAAHQAEFEKALHSVKHQSISSHNSLSQSYW